ncbi:MAG: sulfur carrier protein ThiS [Bacteroidales bacterium]|nr:sulfur carrier protein ThiS [Bacteroidales bacterium]
MKITINNKEREVSSRTLGELARELELPAKGVAVALSGKMVSRSDWDSSTLEEGSRVIIIKAACGG